jgi:hypothetical protein
MRETLKDRYLHSPHPARYARRPLPQAGEVNFALDLEV